MTKKAAPCIYCHDKGWRWGRTSTTEKGRMAKRPCPHCAAGKAFKAKLEKST